MTAEERVAFTNALLNNAGESAISDSVVNAQLSRAKDAILNRLFPLQDYSAYDDVPVRWQVTQCNLAVRYISRMGAEGENKHSETGVSRHYNTTDDSDLLSQIVPYAKVHV